MGNGDDTWGGPSIIPGPTGITRPASIQRRRNRAGPQTRTAGVGMEIPICEGTVDLPGNPRKVWETGWLRSKIQISGGIKLVAGAEGTTSLGVTANVPGGSLSGDLTTKISEGLEISAGGAISGEKMQEITRRIEDGNGLGRTLLSMTNVSAKFSLPADYSFGVGLEWDSDFCFLKTTISTSHTIIRIGRRAEDGLSIRLPGSVTVLFGLTRSGWRQVAQSTGIPAVRRLALSAARSTSRAAAAAAPEAAAESMLRFAGIAMLAYEIARRTQDLTLWLTERARAQGVLRGLIHQYATGYVKTIWFTPSGGDPRVGGRAAWQGFAFPVDSQPYSARYSGILQAIEDILQYGRDVLLEDLVAQYHRPFNPTIPRPTDETAMVNNLAAALERSL